MRSLLLIALSAACAHTAPPRTPDTARAAATTATTTSRDAATEAPRAEVSPAIWAHALEGDPPDARCPRESRAEMLRCLDHAPAGFLPVTSNLRALARAHLVAGRWWTRGARGCEARDVRGSSRRGALDLVTERAEVDGTVARARYGFFEAASDDGLSREPSAEYRWPDGASLRVVFSDGEASPAPAVGDVRRVARSLRLDLTGPHVDVVDARSGRALRSLDVRCVEPLALVHAEAGHLALVHAGRDAVAWRADAAEHWYLDRGRCESETSTVVARLGCGDSQTGRAKGRGAARGAREGGRSVYAVVAAR